MNKGLIALVAGVVVAGVLVLFFQTSNAPPPPTMVPPDTSDIDQGEPIANVRLPSEFSVAAARGKRAFDAKCARCHGENAAGQNGIAPPLIHRYYEPGHHSDLAFLSAAENGVQAHHWAFGNMPKITGLTRANLADIVAYVREIQRANGIE